MNDESESGLIATTGYETEIFWNQSGGITISQPGLKENMVALTIEQAKWVAETLLAAIRESEGGPR